MFRHVFSSRLLGACFLVSKKCSFGRVEDGIVEAYIPGFLFQRQNNLPFNNIQSVISNMSKTSASVSSGVPNTEKQMKARGRRSSAFIVSRCLEPLMKHEARVFDMTSQSRLKKQCNKACKIMMYSPREW